jgi:hypothetical protein
METPLLRKTAAVAKSRKKRSKWPEGVFEARALRFESLQHPEKEPRGKRGG